MRPVFLFPLLFTSGILASASPSTFQTSAFDETTGVLSFHGAGPDAYDAFRDVQIGLMLETDEPDEGTGKAKRGTKTTRDVVSDTVNISFDKRGEMTIHELQGGVGLERRRLSPKAAKAKAKRIASQKKAAAAKKAAAKKAAAKKAAAKKAAATKVILKFSAIPKFAATITWYTGYDLKYPFCADRSGWTPTDNSMIAAVTERWGAGRPTCGSFLQLTGGNGKSIVVRVVDLCGGCKPGVDHVDLSQRAFKSLYNLDIGLVTDIKVRTLAAPPFSKWTSAIEKLYGPQNL